MNDDVKKAIDAYVYAVVWHSRRVREDAYNAMMAEMNELNKAEKKVAKAYFDAKMSKELHYD